MNRNFGGSFRHWRATGMCSHVIDRELFFLKWGDFSWQHHVYEVFVLIRTEPLLSRDIMSCQHRAVSSLSSFLLSVLGLPLSSLLRCRSIFSCSSSSASVTAPRPGLVQLNCRPILVSQAVFSGIFFFVVS